MLVELASCQFQYILGRARCPLYSYSIYFGAGRMPTLVLFNIFWGGQDAHSSPIQYILGRARCPLYSYSIYFGAGRMPTLLLFKRRFSNAVILAIAFGDQVTIHFIKT
ncbi:MAG: hypothetical protein F6K26_22315 [Moorea sp. SIO2I5]|nr:hypothetical protein [Moorena sp. SIO2I5]